MSERTWYTGALVLAVCSLWVSVVSFDVFHPADITYLNFPIEILKALIKGPLVFLFVCGALIMAGKYEVILYFIAVPVVIAFPFLLALRFKKYLSASAVLFGIGCFVFLGAALSLSVLWNEMRRM